MMSRINDIILSYKLPLNRGELSTYEFLKGYYKRFICSLEELILNPSDINFPDSFYEYLSQKAMPVIKRECELLLEVLKLDLELKQTLMKERFNELMELITCEDYAIVRYLSIDAEHTKFIRIRKGSSVYDRKQLFHIPVNKRQFITSQRYSVPGFPCLYLSCSYELKMHMLNDSLKLCWLECGMPSEFSASAFSPQKEMKVFHFAKSGEEYLKEYIHAKRIEDKEDRLNAIRQYLMSFPLRAACSISVNEKSCQFIEEYIIPQLLLSWIKETNEFDGISYQSSISIKYRIHHNAFNVVFPVKNIDETDGLCKSLKSAFKLTAPKKYILSERMSFFIDKINEVENYSLFLENYLRINEVIGNHPYWTLLSLCTTFLSVCSRIKEGSDADIKNMYETLTCINETAYIIANSIRNSNSSQEWITIHSCMHHKEIKSTDKQEILDRFCEICMIFFDLVNRILEPINTGNIFTEEGYKQL